MTLIVPSVGDVLALNLITGKTAQTNLKLHLFKNNVTPTKTDTISTYTESTGTGYASVTLTPANFSTSTVGSTTTTSYPTVTFTYTGSESVYGYYVTNNDSTIVLWAEAFSSVFSIPAGGGQVLVTLNLIAN